VSWNSSAANYEAALVLVDQSIAAAPENSAAIYNRGNILRESGRLTEALESFDRVVALAPRPYGRGRTIAVCAVRTRAPRRSIISYDRALAIKPDHADALFNRGNAMADLRHHEEALKSLRAL